MVGYSGTPLARKLGIGGGMTLHAHHAPEGFAALLEPLPPAVRWKRQLRPPVDLAVAFFIRAADIGRQWPSLVEAVGPDGVVWAAWPKKSSGVATDISEQTFRDEVLPTGWVDTKVCAIDDTWSGLKFVLRKELRAQTTH